MTVETRADPSLAADVAAKRRAIVRCDAVLARDACVAKERTFLLQQRDCLVREVARLEERLLPERS